MLAGTFGAQERGVSPTDSPPSSSATLVPEKLSGPALLLVGVMLLFWGVLIGVELRDLRELASGATHLTSDDATEYSSAALLRESTALRTFGWAQLVAAAGAAMSVLNLLSRRSWQGFAFIALALACILTSSHLFAVAHAQLPESVRVAP
jgi:hypothetical protein